MGIGNNCVAPDNSFARIFPAREHGEIFIAFAFPRKGLMFCVKCIESDYFEISSY